MTAQRFVRGYGWIAFAFVLPAMLLYSSVRTFRELDRMRDVYLRNRAAAIAARLETLPLDNTTLISRIADDEPAFLDLRIFSAPEPGLDTAILDAIWRGVELFHTNETVVDGRPAFRAYVPFHRDGRMRVARIDLDMAAADFLVLHARHNIIIAGVCGATLLAMAAYAIWTIRRRAAEQRKHLELAHLAQLGKMSAVLAHEIRNPLGTIKGFAQLAMEKADPKSLALLEPVVRETQRLEALVNDLLLYGRPPDPAIARVQWNQVVDRLASAVRDQRLAIGNSDIAFDTDANLLHHILVNLARNGLDALADNLSGHVSVRIESHTPGVRILIEDNGPGMQAQVRARAFDAFFTTKPSGTGLGLSIASNLTRSLGGKLTLEAAKGVGVSATVDLPCEFTHAKAAELSAWK